MHVCLLAYRILLAYVWCTCFPADEMAAADRLCILCEKPVIDDGFKLSQRGLETILKFCSLRNDKRVEEYLNEHGLDVVMHNKCRKDYTNDKRLGKRSC